MKHRNGDKTKKWICLSEVHVAIGLNSVKYPVIFPNSVTFRKGGRGVRYGSRFFHLTNYIFPNSTLFTPFSCTESPIQLNRVQSIMSKQQQQLRYCKLIQLGRSIPDLSFNTKVSIISKKGSRITKNCDPRNPPPDFGRRGGGSCHVIP